MKLIFRFITLGILAAAIILPFFVKTENGRPTLAMPTTADFIPDKILPDSITGNTSSNPSASQKSSSSNKVSFYKWQDAAGNWHFGDQPPADAKNLKSMNVNTNANIIKSVKIEKEDNSSFYEAPKAPAHLTDGQLTADDAMNIMGDARAVRDMMESRNDALKSFVGEE